LGEDLGDCCFVENLAIADEHHPSVLEQYIILCGSFPKGRPLPQTAWINYWTSEKDAHHYFLQSRWLLFWRFKDK